LLVDGGALGTAAAIAGVTEGEVEDNGDANDMDDGGRDTIEAAGAAIATVCALDTIPTAVFVAAVAALGCCWAAMAANVDCILVPIAAMIGSSGRGRLMSNTDTGEGNADVDVELESAKRSLNVE